MSGLLGLDNEESIFQDALEMLEHRGDKGIRVKGDYVEK